MILFFCSAQNLTTKVSAAARAHDQPRMISPTNIDCADHDADAVAGTYRGDPTVECPECGILYRRIEA